GNKRQDISKSVPARPDVIPEPEDEGIEIIDEIRKHGGESSSSSRTKSRDPVASALSYIRRDASTPLRFGRDDSAGCRRGLSRARRHREICPFRSAPPAQALSNLVAAGQIGDE